MIDQARSWRRVVSVAACGSLVAGASTGCWAEPSAMPTVRDFLIAWQVGNYKAAAGKTAGAEQAAVASALGQVRRQLDAASMKLGMGLIDKKGETAQARFSVKFDLGENGQPWSYTGRMNLKRIGGRWKVQWDSSIINPRLKPGQRLAVVTEVPARKEIQDSAGKSVLRRVPTDIVGVYPGQLSNPEKTLEQLAKTTRTNGGGTLDADRLLGRVRSAPPQTFLPLLTLERPKNDGLIMRLKNIGGLAHRQIMAPISSTLAPEVVGGLGPATADKLQQVGAPYQPGDTVGSSGLQLLHQRRLAGTPTVRVVAQDPSGKEVQELTSWPGTAPQPIQTTLDRRIQPRADQALASLPYPASLVAVQPSSGAVMAVSNHRTGGRNLAMEGHYPPGLTFGIVSAETLLKGGMREGDKTDCPATITVGGQTFTNPGGIARGQSSLQKNFAYSCATTLAQLSGKVDAATLVAEAGRLGIGKDWGLNFPAFTGTVPKPANEGQKAATMIGQGGVQVSPMAMALVAGAAQSGTWKPPYLLNDPRNPEAAQAQVLDGQAASGLKLLLRRSVFEGTAKGANVDTGGKMHGTAATVTYKDGARDKTVSWFVGWHDDLAFAIAVEGRVSAADIAARFRGGGSAAGATNTR